MSKDSIRPGQATPSEAAELSLRALRVFVAVEESGSMAAAAERIGASGSTVSQQISNLESYIGTKLFDRAARPIALTPAGLLLRLHAHRILDAVNQARSELMELKLSSLPQLRLAIIDDLDATMTPALVGHLNSLYPHCHFSAISGRSDDLTAALLRREADIVVTGEAPGDLTEFACFPLLREPFVLVTARGLLENVGDPMGRLGEAPFVHYSASMPIGRAIESHLRRLRLRLPQRYAFDASRSVFAMVRDVGGWAVTTPLCVLDSARFRPDLEVHPLPFAGLSRTLYLAARRTELGGLPATLADLCRDLLEARTEPAVRDLAPWCGDAFAVLRE